MLYGVVGLLVEVNTLTVGADLGAMAAALQLLAGGPVLLYVAVFAVASVALEMLVRCACYSCPSLVF